MIVGFVGYHAVRVGNLIYKGQKLANQTKKYERQLPFPDRKFLFIGDSAAVGTGASKPEKSIAGLFAADYPRVDIINEGEAGMKLSGLNRKLLDLDERRYDLIVIMVGANDIIQFTPINSVQKTIDHVAGRAKELSDRVVILHSGNLGLAPFFPDFARSQMTSRSQDLRRIYKKVADDRGVVYVDLYAERIDDETNPSYPWWFAPDGLHLNDQGYQHWYDQIQAALRDARQTP